MDKSYIKILLTDNVQNYLKREPLHSGCLKEILKTGRLESYEIRKATRNCFNEHDMHSVFIGSLLLQLSKEELLELHKNNWKMQ